MRYLSKNGIMMCALAVMAIAILAGCASTPPLKTEASTSGIRAAEEAGAAKVPQASLYLQMAKEELDQAKALYEKGDKKEASSMLLRAEADTELAVALSREDVQKTQAQAAMDSVRKLRQDNP